MRLPKGLASLARIIHPLHDRVIVKRFEYQHPVLAVVGVKLEKGVILAVGPGKPRRKKEPFSTGKSGRTIWFEDGPERNAPRHPMPFEPGDVVEFSPRGQTEFELEGETLLMIRAGSIYGKTNDSKSDAMLWQQSAGYDRNGNFLSGAESWDH